ncbi:MAG: TIGR00159 family protein [Bacteroidales bacterium]|nr:TIGR00159 family protein [Bacteroidales bacterium]
MIDLFIPTFINVRLLDILDILLVAYLIYALYNLLKGTAAINIFIGILAVFFIWKLVTALEMELLSEILGAFISVGFIALIVVFQPEIRRFLLLLGTPSFINRKRKKLLFWKVNIKRTQPTEIDPIIDACNSMSETRTGALIVITRKNELRHIAESGEQIDARVSQSLIENIFYKNSPLHDGALIISKNQIKAAACVLPLTKKENFPAGYGLRHRAAVGISEHSDSIAIIVSEQTGRIAYAFEGQLKPHVTPVQLRNLLKKEMEN